MKEHLKNYLATTTDGIPCFYGYKESNNTNSPPLQLWITLDEPKPDGSNYYRIPDELEDSWYKHTIFDEAGNTKKEAAQCLASYYLPNWHYSGILAAFQRLQLADLINKSSSFSIKSWHTAARH